jgi:WhiB family transcriptional regulator, redox-sensing transcriptional regulator
VTGVPAVARLSASTAERAERSLPCQRADPELWFAVSSLGLEQAKALCRPRPIRLDCLAAALRREQPWGVWGGEILDRGTLIPRKRPRGRPRKSELAGSR